MLFWDDGSRRGEVYDLWQRNFQDPVPYADFYFDQYYGRNRVLLHQDQENQVINGSIHLNPYRLHVRGKTFSCSYLVGIATDEEYRRQGIMRAMLRETFAILREEGAPFTYLMPADEAYYLPFDFRFGMSQTEQEIMCLPAREDLRFSITDRLTPEELKEAVRLEEQEKEEIFAIFTEVDEDYLARLDKEAASDYGRMLYVFEDRSPENEGEKTGRQYVGRFCVAAEYDTLLISRIFCRKEFRKDFLKDILRYHEDTYHYGNYQVILDESWDDLLMPAGPVGHVRLLVPHRRKIIMFRITNLEKLGHLLTSRPDRSLTGEDGAKESPGQDQTCGRLYVIDSNLPDQEGYYEVRFLPQGQVFIKKNDQAPGDDWGRIGIGPLTSVIFGDMTLDDLGEEADGLTETGRSGLDCICPLCPACIMEIV